ncbi:MAG: pyrroline-5-carboxylate reductase [Glaciecola sp.]|nr:pyrroline-5-carboxylate reductase [Glaciecola sp.]
MPQTNTQNTSHSQTNTFAPVKIAFIGAGNMTKSIIKGMVANGYPADLIMATNPSLPKLTALQAETGCHISQDNATALTFATTVVLAVKPQMLAQVCAVLPVSDVPKTQFISIAAGVSVARLHDMLGAPCSIVRTMPNTPSSIGMGMTGLYASADTPQSLKDCAEYVLTQVGDVLWVAHEEDINTVIAAAGSSPAYLFLFAEAMQAKTEALGLSAEDAKRLVAQALAGAGAMLLANPDTDFGTLREQVTSKGGTTAQAIDYFNQAQLADIIAGAMQAAVDRAVAMQSSM